MLHKKLENLRMNKNWSMTEVANKLGIALSTYHGYESGKSFPKSHIILVNMTKLYGVSLEYLIGNESSSNYKIAEQINTDYEATEFLKHIHDYTKSMSIDERVAFAKTIFYFIKKRK